MAIVTVLKPEICNPGPNLYVSSRTPALLWFPGGQLSCAGGMVKLDDLAYQFVMSIPRHRKRYLFLVISSLMSVYLANKKRIDDHITGRAKEERRQFYKTKRSSLHNRKVGVDATFLAQLRQLVPICVPGNHAHYTFTSNYASLFRNNVK